MHLIFLYKPCNDFLPSPYPSLSCQHTTSDLYPENTKKTNHHHKNYSTDNKRSFYKDSNRSLLHLKNLPFLSPNRNDTCVFPHILGQYRQYYPYLISNISHQNNNIQDSFLRFCQKICYKDWEMIPRLYQSLPVQSYMRYKGAASTI